MPIKSRPWTVNIPLPPRSLPIPKPATCSLKLCSLASTQPFASADRKPITTPATTISKCLLLKRSIPPTTTMPRLRTRPCIMQGMKDASTGKRSEEHTSELQSLMRISYAVFCLKKKTDYHPTTGDEHSHTLEHT